MLLDKETWIVEATITDMQQAMGNGWITSEEIVQLYIDRIDQYDPKLRSILEVNPDAAEIARSLDMERREKGSRGKLHGIPIVLKDNIDTGDRMHTSAGSLALADSYASEDSFVAAKLRSAGAVLLGKANMTEWANFMSTTMFQIGVWSQQSFPVLFYAQMAVNVIMSPLWHLLFLPFWYLLFTSLRNVFTQDGLSFLYRSSYLFIS